MLSFFIERKKPECFLTYGFSDLRILSKKGCKRSLTKGCH